MRLNPSVTEVARNFAHYINQVAFRGERFVLMRGKKAVAELGPVVAGRRLGELRTLLGGLPRLSPSDVEHFSADLAQARGELSNAPPRDPWQS